MTGKERRLWERGGRWEGGRGCRTIRSSTKASAGRRGSCCVCFVRMVVPISQQTRKITDRVSVICPHNRKGLTFVEQDAVGWQHARHGRQNELIKALHCSSCPYTIFLISLLLIDERGILMRSSRRLHLLQPVPEPKRGDLLQNDQRKSQLHHFTIGFQKPGICAHLCVFISFCFFVPMLWYKSTFSFFCRADRESDVVKYVVN
jgi:hypothetical protein